MTLEERKESLKRAILTHQVILRARHYWTEEYNRQLEEDIRRWEETLKALEATPEPPRPLTRFEREDVI